MLVDHELKLKELQVRMTAENLPFTLGVLRDVHTWYAPSDVNGDDPCVIYHGYTINFDRSGYVVDRSEDDEFLDQGSLDETIQYIKTLTIIETQQ